MGAAAIRRLRQLVGRFSDRIKPYSATQDMAKAFRQLGVRDEDRPLHIVAVYHPKDRCWVFGELDGLAFGLGAAVLEFNRVPAHLVALARRWFAIPVVNLYDDFSILELYISGALDPSLSGTEGANYFFEMLCAFTGWKLDPKKKQGPAASIVFLGVLEDASRASEDDVVMLKTTEDRREAILKELAHVREVGACTRSEMQHLVGKLLYVADALPGRLGRGMLSALTEHISRDTRALDSKALHAITFQEYLLSVPRFRAVPLGTEAYPSRAVISDASWGDLESIGLLGRVCFIVLDPANGRRIGGVLDIPHGSDLVADLEVRRTQIQAAETFGPLLALRFANGILNHCSVNFFIDNLSGLCCLAKGGSRRHDLSAITLGVSLGIAHLDVRPWWDYVESASNIADGGSRTGLLDQVAADMDIKLKPIHKFGLPRGFPMTTPGQWQEWLDEALIGSAYFLS